MKKRIELRFTNPKTGEFAIWCVPPAARKADVERVVAIQRELFGRTEVVVSLPLPSVKKMKNMKESS